MNPHILTDSTGQRKAKQASVRRSAPVAPIVSPAELPLQFFRGVGPARAQLLARMGILRPDDLLHVYPRGWEDRRLLHALKSAPMSEKIVLRGIIRDILFSTTRSNLGIATVVLEDHGAQLEAVWFKRLNPRYDVFSPLRTSLTPNRRLLVYGAIEWGPSGRQLRVEDFALLSESDGTLSGEDVLHFERIVPQYTVTEGIPERFLRSLIGRALALPMAVVGNVLPSVARENAQWPDRAWSIQTIHFPKSLIEKERAREALAFEEFLILETALGLLRRKVKHELKNHRFTLTRKLLTPFREALGFQFTAAQKRVIREIFDDMMRPTPMNRLLQGDVGSGKTLVALSVMLLAVESGGQAALMAPTEILAEQHAITFGRFLKHLPIRWAVITGRQTPSQKRILAESIAKGEMDLVIGTHALIQKHVTFQRLMVAVIDEQHRFGVQHRSLLRQKGNQPDILVMTATPIPRTLALTVYGDLDVSVVDELPPGRQPIVTQHVEESQAYERIRIEVGKGRQAYIVFPLVEESDKVELKAAVQEAETLKRTTFSDLSVGVLHGQLNASEKEDVMERFRRGALDVLIATSIIEVGIDVPNATVMAIQHAERFGLSTLHQLRGRVGRGKDPSSCLLIAEIKNEDARRRINIMVQTTDGFRISEEDLSLRGPGEVIGVMQHGLPEFKIGNIVRDGRIIQQARELAESLLTQDPSLSKADHAALRQAVVRQFGGLWALGLTA